VHCWHWWALVFAARIAFSSSLMRKLDGDGATDDVRLAPGMLVGLPAEP